MILIGGFVKYPPGTLEGLKGAMQQVVQATRNEDGCIDYDFAIDVSDPTRLVIFERWRDQAALDGHFKSPHIAAWREAAVAAAPVESNLTLWEVDEGRRL